MEETYVTNVLARLLSSDIKAELLQLFHGNPNLSYSLEKISKQIDRSKREIEPELKDLLALGVVRKTGKTGFCLDEEKDKQIQSTIIRQLLWGERKN